MSSIANNKQINQLQNFTTIKDLIKIKYLIRNIPIDIVRKIYDEYIKPDLIYSHLIRILNLPESKKLNYKPLYNIIQIIFSNEIILNFLIKNNKIFNDIYQTHITQNKKTFILLPDNLSSLSLSWLMYLYH